MNAVNIADEGSPLPLTPTPALPGQECYLYTYILLKKELNGVLGLLKVVSTHGQPKSCIEDFKRAAATNKNCPMKWHETGKWVAIRRPETDTDGTVDIVKLEDEEEDFFGEKLVQTASDPSKNNGATISRDSLTNSPSAEILKDTISKEAWKDDRRARSAEEKRVQLRKQALEELEEEINNQETLAAYAQLHWKRLTQKSAIAEYQEKIKEAQESLLKTIIELKNRDRKYPEYQHGWTNEIRRIKNLYNPSGGNPVDNPIANLGTEDDEKLVGSPIPSIEDPFDTGIGVEAKPQPEKEKGPVLPSPQTSSDASARSVSFDVEPAKQQKKKKDKKDKKGKKHSKKK